LLPTRRNPYRPFGKKLTSQWLIFNPKALPAVPRIVANSSFRR
jgi:hypothetical protein